MISPSYVYSQTVLLDDLEDGTGFPRVVNPGETQPDTRYLFNQSNDYPSEGLGTVATVTSDKHDGTASMRVRITAGEGTYMQFYPQTSSSTPNWRYMKEYIQPPSAWVGNTFNRCKFWVKHPVSFPKATPGTQNVELGTFSRRPTSPTSRNEDDNMHWYHFYNIPPTGEWHQIIWDTHPNHQRSENGGTEQGDQQYPWPALFPTTQYFDALTYWYYDTQGSLSAHPADWYFDRFECYTETNPENINQIYSLNAVYVPSSNTVYVGWMRNKNDNSVNHDVRYAFTNIWTLGYANATPAPGGTGIVPPDFQGANGMEYQTTGINVSGQNTLYIAIKPQNSSLMRQIAIPISLSAGGDTTAPSAPANLRVLP